MTNPLHAPHYADSAVQHQVPIVSNPRVATDTHCIRFSCPEIAAGVVPGQFLMVKLAGLNDPLIGRPLAVYNVLPSSAGEPESIELVYHVRGKFTRQLAQMPIGQPLEIWGPLGNGFPALHCEHLIMVAGGIGHTPFLTLAKEHLGRQSFGNPPREIDPADKITFCYGAASADHLAGMEDFRQLGIELRLATDDGSIGSHGLVTDELQRVINELDIAASSVQIVCCGPAAMMRATAQIAADRQLPCLVSLETPMACGVGICFTCVALIRDQDGHSDYKRTCVEGPVFDATSVEW